jgi:CRISPR-associated protein Cas6
MQIEVMFPVRGELIPTDHAYLLYAALSHCVREFHDKAANVRFAPLSGKRAGKGAIRIDDSARLRVRLPADQIAVVLALAGRTLELGGHRLTLRPPTVVPLVPAPALVAKLVTFKHSMDPESFVTAARRELDEKGIGGEPGIPLIQQGERKGEPRRIVLRIKGVRIVGYALQVIQLTAEESLRLQEEGLGGRGRIGCGYFLPVCGRTR